MEYIISVFNFTNLYALIIGVVVGLIIGALPGMGAYTGVALLIPLTFVMTPTSSLLMLTALYTAGIYGGSLTAILLYVPGTSASAVTAIEGYEFTKRGRPMEAIQMATFASVTGGLISGVLLLLVAPPLSQVSLAFGPPEYFLLAVFGLTAVGSIASGKVVKGLISGFIGLFLSTIGIDLNSGYPRYTFGISGLEGGIDVVSAVIGLFALSQVLILSEDPFKKAVSTIKKVGWNVFPNFSQIKKVGFFTFLRSYIIGIFIGLLPAAGANVAQWISYAEARRVGKPEDNFGKGSLKGIAAAEAANNATTGSSLVPLFVFGIPGSVTAAILLGALMIHGLTPGITLFTRQAHIVYPVIWGFIFANVIMAGFAILFVRQVANFVRLPRGILIPLIVTLCVVGVYAKTNSFFQIWVMSLFGLMGYGMRKTDFSPAAVLLGLILGPICESGFRSTLNMADTFLVFYLVRRPISLGLLALTIIVVLFIVRREIRESRLKKQAKEKV
ncbi:tripartite tricarboxylate transporter permease [Candidatus Aerophobetes bacterium]|nr:tripartite tricarboxylate transporter permease [Candidatus Aerophobetes bacterium]